MNDNLNVIEIKNINIKFPMRIGTVCASNNVRLNIRKGQITALVGESGSGKSTIASAILKSVSSPGVIESGEILYNGQNILEYSEAQLKKYKWAKVSMVFQAAQNALNPVMTIMEQIEETYLAHREDAKAEEILKRAIEVLEFVRLNPDRVLKAYPHELSGGMKQRVMIAFALLLKPDLIILDEPTTALDVITQDYIFNLLKEINRELGISMLLLTHDIGVVAKVADIVGVMYAGEMIEVGDVFEMFENSKHPYTKSLICAAPSLINDTEVLYGLKGAPPNLLNLPSGCSFNPRCEYAKELCRQQSPSVLKFDDVSLVKCHKNFKENKELWNERVDINV